MKTIKNLKSYELLPSQAKTVHGGDPLVWMGELGMITHEFGVACFGVGVAFLAGAGFGTLFYNAYGTQIVDGIEAVLN